VKKAAVLWLTPACVFALAAAVLAQKPAEPQPAGAADVVDVAETSARLNQAELVKASAEAFEARKFEDAAYLFFLAELRFEIDKRAYPSAKAKFQRGIEANKYLRHYFLVYMIVWRKEGVLASILQRAAGWSPEFPAEYSPGWKSTAPVAAAARSEIVISEKRKFQAARKVLLQTISNKEYVRIRRLLEDQKKSLALLRAIEGEDFVRPVITPAELTAALKRGAEIETTAGFKYRYVARKLARHHEQLRRKQ